MVRNIVRSRLKIDNTYLFSRLRTRENNANIFNNHTGAASGTGKSIVSSLRAIAQYNATPYAESVEQCGEYLHFPADDKEFLNTDFPDHLPRASWDSCMSGTTAISRT